MKLTLDIDASTTFAGELKELLHALSDEQKAKLAEQLVVQVLSNVDSRLSTSRGIKQALAEMNEGRNGHEVLHWKDTEGLQTSGASWHSHPSARDREQFQKLVRKYSDIAEYFNSFVFAEIAGLARKEVEERISKTPQVTELIDQAVKVAEQNLKHIVTSALTSSLIRTIRNGLDRMDDLNLEHETLKTTVDDMKQRLLPEGC